ncbi:MAG: heavy metal translocating P-type ATPase [Dichotomicrobium sp.]
MADAGQLIAGHAAKHDGAIAGDDTQREDDTPLAPATGTAETVTLTVENMHCGGCMTKVERVLSATPGVVSARANLTARRVTATIDNTATSVPALTDALSRAGFNAAELADDAPAEPQDDNLLRAMAVAGFAAANVMLLSVAVWAGAAGDMTPEVQALFHWVSALIALPAIAYSGQPFFASAADALKGWRLNMDVPISLAILLAASMSLYQTIQGTEQVYFDAAVTLLFFLLIGRFLDQRMRRRAKGAAQNLMALQAGEATVIGDGPPRRVSARALRPGMHVLIGTGDRVPADGVIAGGASEIDESLITGETLPRTVSAGADIHAGTLNLGAPIEMTVQAADDSTLLAEIRRLMETAEQAKGSYVRLADRAARIYAPAVHAFGAITFIGWTLAGAGWETALTYAIAVLIITCPCALALAVPAVQVVASGRFFADGVILKAADGFERLAEVDTVILDKTGTLTLGMPQLVNGGEIDDATLAEAASLALASRHPYSQAIVAEATRRGLMIAPAEKVREFPGQGLSQPDGAGEVKLGAAVWCGVGEASDDSQDETGRVWFARPRKDAVVFIFADQLRADARETVRRLLASGMDVRILSGDRAAAVARAAEAIGVTQWRAAQRPDDKIRLLDDLKAQGRKVLMVGDGLNDAPALAAGHASMSPASATHISQTAADAIFQGARLAPVADAIALARRARRTALQNFGLAAVYNAICIPLAMAGHVSPLIAAVAMSASSIAVTGNAVRLRGARISLEPGR